MRLEKHVSEDSFATTKVGCLIIIVGYIGKHYLHLQYCYSILIVNHTAREDHKMNNKAIQDNKKLRMPLVVG